MYKIKTRNFLKSFNKNKEKKFFILPISFYHFANKYNHDLNQLFVNKMKDEITDVVIQKFARLKPKIYSFSVDDISEHRKTK